METQPKTHVQIIQELIAIHTTRIEVVERLQVKQITSEVKSLFSSAKQQSKKFTSELMSELSEFGDSVMESVDKENEYQHTWKNALGKIDNMTSQDSEKIFLLLESALKNTYQEILKVETNLPDSLQGTISKQEKEIIQ